MDQTLFQQKVIPWHSMLALEAHEFSEFREDNHSQQRTELATTLSMSFS